MAKGKSAKTCEVCRLLNDPKSFARGTKARFVQDCKTCETRLAQPLVSNENIVSIYEALPTNYDGLSGYKIVTAEGIRFLFEIYDVPKIWWEDYYNRLMYFHSTYIQEKEKRDEEKRKREERQIKQASKKALPKSASRR